MRLFVVSVWAYKSDTDTSNPTDVGRKDTMDIETSPANPFELMIDAPRVVACMERSEALRHLEHRVCHPLDKLPPGHFSSELAAFDALIDAEDDADRRV